ncbi:hypothetical protein ACH5A2_18295 [Streptomyces collinus]|uniref:hypothetical protein n=1 Tax=Streptomyces collinus TaxID=42684 RepID=UPI0037923A83
MPLPLIALILMGAAALTVVVLAIVYYDEIVDWFQSRNDLKESDKENVGVTVKTWMKEGNYKIVQGIFNKRTETLVDGRVMRTKEVDHKLDQVHGPNEIVVYE